MPKNPLIQDGMVIAKTKDPRRGYCYYTYSAERDAQGKKAVCFPDMVAEMEALGFEILPHWTNHGNVAGWYSIRGLEYHGPYNSVELVEVSPIVSKILEGNIHNLAFRDLLSLDNA